MKRSNNRTEFVMLKAFTNSEWDQCDFAILQMTAEWKETMKKRLWAIGKFKDDLSFYNQSYFESRVHFYKNASGRSQSIEQMIGEDENWCFVELDGDELLKLSTPETHFNSFQIVINRYERAYFTADGKNPNEEFTTEFFSVRELLGLTDEDQTTSEDKETISLKELLTDFESRASAAIIKELKRINRTVCFEDLSCDPFNQDTIEYIEAIRLDNESEIVFDTSFADINEKGLSAMLSDNEINHWGIIDLLEMLTMLEY